MAVSALVDDFYGHQSVLAQDVLAINGSSKTAAKSKKMDGAIDAWADTRRDAVERSERLLADLKATDAVDLAMLAVANGQMRTLSAR